MAQAKALQSSGTVGLFLTLYKWARLSCLGLYRL